MDKPPGMSSARLVSKVKKRMGTPKVGHCGTLDPFATGLMVLCIGKATRLARFLLHGPKSYRGVLRLGKRTDTQDITGTVIETASWESVREEDIRKAFEKFRGPILQIPPAYSALKHQGTPLYKLAREGKPVQKPPRLVQIHSLEIIEIDLPEVRFDVTCSAGTYIRTLCEDIGNTLGCGGCLMALRRTESCGFSLDRAVSLRRLTEILDEIEEKGGHVGDLLVPMVEALKFMPRFVADEQQVARIENGIAFSQVVTESDTNVFPMVEKKSDNGPDQIPFFKVVDRKGRLVAVVAREKFGEGYNYCCVFPQ